MCRSTADVWVALGGTGLAGITAVLKMHWDMVRDRNAWREARRHSSDKKGVIQEPGARAENPTHDNCR